ncbi:MAG: ECF transporter S component [Solobacterium sp.]|nr:ECF transporter S component [Solobacterium sp.]
MTTSTAERSNIHVLTKIAILGAIAFVLMMIEFPIPFIAPPFYKMDFSELPVLLGGFALGPMAAVGIEALKIVLNLLFQGTSTAYVGEMANFLIGISLSVPAALIYGANKTKNSAVKGMVIGSVTMAIVGVLLNYFVLLPAYSFFYHLQIDTIVEMGGQIFPFVTNKLIFVIACVTPFNLLKGIMISVITALIYKRVSPVLHR